MERVFTQTFGVAGAIMEKGGKILLVKENMPGRADHGKWNHPAGWIDVGEDPAKAIIREVKEETGLDFKPKRLLGVYSLVKKGEVTRHPLKIIFTGEFGGEARPNPKEILEARWFSPEEIRRMDRKTLRDLDIKEMVRDYFSGKKYALEIVRHTVQRI